MEVPMSARRGTFSHRRGRAVLALAAVLAVALAALAGIALAMPTTSHTTPARGAAPATSAAKTHVTFTSKTIFVDRKTVKRNLIGISADRTTFKFKHAAGALKRLRAGKVMVLVGADARIVTKIRHSHGQLLVITRAANLPDVIKSGHIGFSGPLNLQKSFEIQTGTFHPAHAATDFVRPAFPYVGGASGRDASAASAATFGGAGSFGPGGIFGFSMNFSHPSASRIQINGTICLQAGSVCSTGPSNGLSAEVNLSGYVDVGDTTVGIDMNAGKVRHADIGINHLSGDFKVNYLVARGPGAADNPDPPVIRLPIGAGVSIPTPYGIPIYLKLQLAVLLKLGVSSKNAVIRGKAEVTTNGSEHVSETAGKVTPSGSDSVTGTITPGNSESLAASGVVVAAQFPKLGVGLGTNVVNGIAFVDVVESMGQTVGSALAGQFCSNYDLYVDVGGGFEAQVGPFVASKKVPIIPQKAFRLTQPPCPAS
jgi:hypothetical protein